MDVNTEARGCMRCFVPEMRGSVQSVKTGNYCCSNEQSNGAGKVNAPDVMDTLRIIPASFASLPPLGQ